MPNVALEHTLCSCVATREGTNKPRHGPLRSWAGLALPEHFRLPVSGSEPTPPLFDVIVAPSTPSLEVLSPGPSGALFRRRSSFAGLAALRTTWQSGWNTRTGRPQSTLTQALWIALSGFRKLDDLSSDDLTNWIGVVGGGAERPKRHLNNLWPSR
jgi:hypothetical protein